MHQKGENLFHPSIPRYATTYLWIVLMKMIKHAYLPLIKGLSLLFLLRKIDVHLGNMIYYFINVVMKLNVSFCVLNAFAKFSHAMINSILYIFLSFFWLSFSIPFLCEHALSMKKKNPPAKIMTGGKNTTLKAEVFYNYPTNRS